MANGSPLTVLSPPGRNL